MTIEKRWLDLASQLLEKSLNPLPHELNELDWKVDVSSKGAQNLAKHISAFANYTHGGYLVFGIDDHGQINDLDHKKNQRDY